MRSLANKSEKILEVEQQTGERIELTLHREYIIKNKSANQIAKEMGLNQRIVLKWLGFMGIRHKFDRDRFIELLKENDFDGN